MKPVAYHRLAASELIKSAEFYERRSASLGEAFLVIVEATLPKIQRNPELGKRVPSWNRLTPEMQTNRVIKPAIRYSEAFKLQVVSELEREGLTAATLTRKYGVRGHGTVIGWVRKYGNGSRGKVIRVETPQEINELKKLKERVKRLETALADANIELALERAYTKIACQRAGIEDVEEFKKKSAGTQRT